MSNALWHLRGYVPLESDEDNRVILDRVEHLLARQRKPITERTADYVRFDRPLWTAFGENEWLAMVPYDRGRFCIEQTAESRLLRYELRSFHIFIFCLVGALLFFIAGLADGGIVYGLCVAASCFAWLYGLNALLSWAQVPGTIRRAVREP